MVERNPVCVLRMARASKAAPRGMRADDVANLLAALAVNSTVAARREHALVAFLAATGARLGSALALDVADLDLDECAAVLRELEGGGEMSVYLRPELVEPLADWLGGRPSGPFFAALDGDARTGRHSKQRFEHRVRARDRLM